MKKHYTIFDLCAWGMNGLIVGLMIWFIHASYGTARQMGYTPDARAHLDYLVSVYNEPDMSNVKPLSIKDLK